MNAETPSPIGYRMIADLTTGMIWQITSHDVDPDQFGIVMSWFNPVDEADAQTQANNGYMRTAGCPFSPFPGHELILQADGTYILLYKSDGGDEEQDPPLAELCRARLRGELIMIFDYDFVCIVKADKTYVVARCD
jgi:hypothetical protein